MVDNVLMASPAQVIIGTKNTQNITDKPSKKIFDKEECGEIVDDERYDDQYKGGGIVNIWSTESPIQVNIGAKHTQNTTDTPFNKNFDQEKVGEIVDDEVDDNKEEVGEIADDEGHDDQ